MMDSVIHTKNGAYVPLMGEREKLACDIAEWMTYDGTQHTNYGSWCIYYDEINSLFGVDIKEDTELLKMVEDQFDCDIVSDFEEEEDCITMTFYTSFCPCYDNTNDPGWAHYRAICEKFEGGEENG